MMALDFGHVAAIAQALGLEQRDIECKPMSGGDIAQAFVLQTPEVWLFLKTLPIEQAGLLSAEADGLEALAQTDCVRVPALIGRGNHEGLAWLALELLPLRERSPRCDARLGRQLAELHRCTGERFGWHRANFIGRTPQLNTPSEDWPSFFARCRLAPQFDRLAADQPDASWNALAKEVLAAWEKASAGYQPVPSLIHGDLWHGNAGGIADDEPVIFDPAVHYADRECDLAMANLFGGFDDAFFEAYQKAWPLAHGYGTRRLFYKLYHMLNHAHLFGAPYLEAAGHLCRRILDT